MKAQRDPRAHREEPHCSLAVSASYQHRAEGKRTAALALVTQAGKTKTGILYCQGSQQWKLPDKKEPQRTSPKFCSIFALPECAESYTTWTEMQETPVTSCCKEAKKLSRALPAAQHLEFRACQGIHVLVNMPGFQVKR